MKFVKSLAPFALRALLLLKPLAVRLLVLEISKRQAKLDSRDREDALQFDVLDVLKDELAAL